ncbi:DUF4150 domain-containing protein [Pseudomonas sp. SK3(2021)]|uniref:DUF4150 domain-containing protein n=1 Tax=Pseudomonas sp. SK3(2021) TaxID=2841064 RepID=UPI00192B41A7|nr:DUF4150 domain-containing protein [Pseudomonas sp. SK3(2021)]QQZ39467.1 DUF4150 domain-containing protein [Pseudomonas sp. SK3(2021)]
MTKHVYANGREVSCKASSGKSICSFPDVCFTPPQTAATPLGVPIPYPNTAFASATSNGSKSVKIGRQEVMLKDKSYFKKSTGDEAGRAPKKNVITNKIKGKAYFITWSMNVKVEGKNIVRHMDLTTHNHGSKPAGAPAALHAALAEMGNITRCAQNKNAIETECNPWEVQATCPEDTEKEIQKAENRRSEAKHRDGENSPAHNEASDDVRVLYMQYAEEIESNDCRRALRCALIPFNKIKKVKCKRQTGDHLVENATVNSLPNYKKSQAPTAIVDGPTFHIGTHGIGHERRTQRAQKWPGKSPFSIRASAAVGAVELRKTFPNASCDPNCIYGQLVAGHKAMGIQESDLADKPTLNSHHNLDSQKQWNAANARIAARNGGK